MDISLVSCTKQGVAQEVSAVKIDVTGPITVTQDVGLAMTSKQRGECNQATLGWSRENRLPSDKSFALAWLMLCIGRQLA
jgi:hypothetical protein